MFHAIWWQFPFWAHKNRKGWKRCEVHNIGSSKHLAQPLQPRSSRPCLSLDRKSCNSWCRAWLATSKRYRRKGLQSIPKATTSVQSAQSQVPCTITKAKLKTFTHLNKKVSVIAGRNQEVILKADRRLFAQMIVIAESRNLQMKEVLSHPPGPLLWSLATPDVLMRKPNKASLAKAL